MSLFSCRQGPKPEVNKPFVSETTDSAYISVSIVFAYVHVVSNNSYSIYCYAAMSPAGLQSAVRSRQVHLLKQGTHVGCGLPTLFNITDITNSLAELHFKATRWVIGELLKVNTANWIAFPLKYKVFDKYMTSTTKKGL